MEWIYRGGKNKVPTKNMVTAIELEKMIAPSIECVGP